MLVKHHNYSYNFDDTVRFFYLHIYVYIIIAVLSIWRCVSFTLFWFCILIIGNVCFCYKTIEIFNNTFITRLPCQVSFNMILCIILNTRSYMYFLWNYTTDHAWIHRKLLEIIFSSSHVSWKLVVSL